MPFKDNSSLVKVSNYILFLMRYAFLLKETTLHALDKNIYINFPNTHV